MAKAIEHELKCLPVYYNAIECGDKTFDVRRDDRGFQRGDTVVLQKYDRAVGYMGPELRFKISWILTGGQFGIEPGFVVLALGEKATRL